MGEVLVVAFDERWSSDFERIAAVLRDAIDGIPVSVDHIGSTSVPGLAAKDVIDVQVSVTTWADLRLVCDQLAAVGFGVRSESRDHRVAGAASDDPSDWAKGFCSERPGERRTNIHIRVLGQPNQVFALLFRDYLRTDPPAAAAYVAFKRKAAVLLAHDSYSYADVKDPVCDLVYFLAKEWATATGWSPGGC